MKRDILLILVMLLTLSGIAQEVKISDEKIVENNGEVTVCFMVGVDKLSSNEKMTIVPVLYSATGNKELQAIVLTGRNKAISEKRTGCMPNTRWKKGESLSYVVTIPYESWMSEVSLRIDRKIESCCNEKILASYDIVMDKLIRYDFVPPVIEPLEAELTAIQKLDLETPFLLPAKEYSAVTADFDAFRAEGALLVRFKQGGVHIDPSFADNGSALEQVRKVMDLIESDPEVSLGKIVLAGASSPEGAALHNEKLSQRRADALRLYLGEKISVRANLFETINIGEDWTGLSTMVEASDMEYKDEVLKIIDTYPILKGREVELMKLKGGRPYNYMLKHFFPSLRSAGYIRIYYESKPLPDFEPINQAIGLYNKKEYSAVLLRLEDVTPTGTTENIRGICYMMLGNYQQAEAALKKAVVWGDTQAPDNLRQLDKLKSIRK